MYVWFVPDATLSHSDASIAELFSVLNKYQLSYAYNGNFTDDLTGRILSLAETNMEVESESSKTRKKVYFIMVESLQNITRHQGSPDERLMDGFFSIHKYHNGYLITSGNIVENNDIADLTQKLNTVNSMDQDKLKEYSKEILKSGGFSNKGGAGLGLIEMVRKSGNKLEFDFKKLDDKYSYFYFQACISMNVPEGQTALGTSDVAANLEVVKKSHRAVTDNHLKIFFHGQFQHENLKSLLSMAEGTISVADNIAFKKAVVAVMIELLQNICYHAAGKNETDNERPGLFMVSDYNNVCSLITGNYIENSKKEEFLERVDYVNTLDKESLNKLFLKTILEENKEEGKPGAGLGLIDIRFKTKNKIEVNVVPYNNEKSFVIMKANLNY